MEHDTCPVCRHDYKKELSRALRARLPWIISIRCPLNKREKSERHF
jgi:hypothetical protein